MHRTPAPRTLVAAAFALVLAAALLAPVVAFAAGPAAFSGTTPVPGYSFTSRYPTLYVYFYDRAGVRGTGVFTMRLDGVRVPAGLSYKVVRGHVDYRRAGIRYRPKSPLGYGAHTVAVTVRNRSGRYSSYSWSFTILSPTPPVPPVPLRVPMPISQTACTACHLDYPALHPMTACAGCHGPGSPIGGGFDLSSSTPHSDPQPSVHVAPAACVECHPTQLSSNCASCHSGTYASVPPSHDSAEAQHVAPASPCSACHDDALTVEHYKTRTLTCASCHASANVVVKAAIAADAPACAGCHIVDGTGQPHTARVQMPVSGSACADCHVGYPGQHPMTACAGCHGPGSPIGGGYSPGSSPHADPQASVHADPAACSECHGTQLSSDCASCHGGAYVTVPQTHSMDIAQYHESPTTMCRPCHDRSLTVEHYRQSHGGAHLTCAACHESADPAVRTAIAAGDTRCESCHPEKPDGHKTVR